MTVVIDTDYYVTERYQGSTIALFPTDTLIPIGETRVTTDGRLQVAVYHDRVSVIGDLYDNPQEYYIFCTTKSGTPKYVIRGISIPDGGNIRGVIEQAIEYSEYMTAIGETYNVTCRKCGYTFQTKSKQKIRRFNDGRESCFRCIEAERERERRSKTEK